MLTKRRGVTILVYTMGILLDIAYALGLAGTSPLWIYRMIRHGRYRADWSQRLGAAPVRYGLQPVIWIHGVSVGEINAAKTLVNEIHRQLPDFRVAISSTTDTGISAARKNFEPDHEVFRWPMDFSLTVRRALKRMRPTMVVLIEGEAWPNFLAACNRMDIPVVIVNGRISAEKGYKRWRMLGPLAGRVFNRLSAMGLQDEIYAQRLRHLGADEGKLHITGMMKFDTAEIADRIAGQDELATAVGLGSGEELLVAGGTGPGEEKIVLELYAELKKSHPRLRVAIVPRKPERFDEVARLIASAGLDCVRRSENPDGTQSPNKPDSVILGDTMGELRKFYALARVIFVGRSLVPMGGSDMIEAAALGKPVAFGPYTHNFPQADALSTHGCARVPNARKLRKQLDYWLSNPAEAEQDSKSARRYVRSQQGATARNVEMICRILNRRPPLGEGAVATDDINWEQ